MWNKNKTLKVATVFSGIGAPEFALRRLGVKHDVIFACDNGDTKLDLLTPNERLALDGIDSSRIEIRKRQKCKAHMLKHYGSKSNPLRVRKKRNNLLTVYMHLNADKLILCISLIVLIMELNIPTFTKMSNFLMAQIITDK